MPTGTPKTPKQDNDAELAALNQKVIDADTKNAEQQAEIDGLQKTVAELVEENGKLQTQLVEIRNRRDEMERLLKEKAEQVEKLQKELDSRQVEQLPQVVNIDVLAAAAYGRNKFVQAHDAAREGIAIHNEIIAQVKASAKS